MYERITGQLRDAYDRSAEDRQNNPLPDWKIGERRAFFELLQSEGKESILEIGAGTGKDSYYFQSQGMKVVSTDLSPKMVELCRSKGLEAYEMDFLNLDFPDSHFDAVFALNCLLHVPGAELAAVLDAIKRVIKPAGLFFMGVYGGFSQQGIWEEDHHNPKRFFAFYTDEQLLETVTRTFELHNFQRIILPEISHPEMHFQRFYLRKI